MPANKRFHLPALALLCLLAGNLNRAVGEPSSGLSQPLRRVAAVPENGISTVSTTVLLDQERRAARMLVNRLIGINWLSAANPLHEVKSSVPILAKLTATALANGEIQLDLELRNSSAEAVNAIVTFPLLRGLSPGGNPSDLAYCFPRSGAAIGTMDTRLKGRYCGSFPLQFMDVFHPAAGGIYLMSQDTTNSPKTFWLKKQNGAIDLGIDRGSRSLESGEVWKLPCAVIATHRGDWHEALAAYRRWVNTWYRPAVPRKAWFREVFNFRQMFLHDIFGAPGAFDSATKQYRMHQMVEEDAKAFGGVDYIHIFDWSTHPKWGRVGDYKPWDYLGGVKPFRKQIRETQADGIHVGLYLEAYLLSPESKAAQAHDRSWQMLDVNGKPYTRMGNYVYTCPHDRRWQEHLSLACVRAVQDTGANGIYLDELGFGWQYPCHASNHGHPVPSNQNLAEADLLQGVRAALPPSTVLYTEEIGTDVNTQYQDGSFTYAITSSRNGLNPARINLTRFALPDFKLFEIIRCDVPLGNDLEAVRHIFFNGEGIWLEGPVTDPKWFPPGVRRLIQKTHRILRENRDAFSTLDPIPLVPTLHKDIYANRFPAGAKTVWTLYNASSQAIAGKLLEVVHTPGSKYYDAWNGLDLSPVIVRGKGQLSLRIGPHEVGCVVQHRRLKTASTTPPLN